MDSYRIQVTFFSILVGGLLVLAFLILQPYIVPLVLALIFAVSFYPFYKWLMKWTGNKSGRAAFLAVVIILLAILIPAILFGAALFQEVKSLYWSLSQAGTDSGFFHSLTVYLQDHIRVFSPDTTVDINDYLQRGLNWIVANMNTFFSSLFNVLVSLVLMLFALFFFLKDGGVMVKEAVRLSPLPDTEDNTIFKRIAGAVNSVILGNFIVGVVKALLSIVGFVFFSIPNPVFWGVVSGISSLIPAVGTAIVFIPAAIYLFFIGSVWSALGVLIWGFVIVGLVDNILLPSLMTKGMKVHPFIVLLSVFGGIAFFGPIGVVVGPIVIAILFALLETFPIIIKK